MTELGNRILKRIGEQSGIRNPEAAKKGRTLRPEELYIDGLTPTEVRELLVEIGSCAGDIENYVGRHMPRAKWILVLKYALYRAGDK